MPELLNGKDEIYFVQPMDAKGTDGLFIAFQTEGSHTKNRTRWMSPQNQAVLSVMAQKMKTLS